MNAPAEVIKLLKTLLLEVGNGMLASDAMVAVHDDGLVGRNFLMEPCQAVEWDQQGLTTVAEVADLPLFWLTHIQQQPVFFLLQALCKFFGTDVVHEMKLQLSACFSYLCQAKN